MKVRRALARQQRRRGDVVARNAIRVEALDSMKR